METITIAGTNGKLANGPEDQGPETREPRTQEQLGDLKEAL